ncbi:hypothetical protein EYC98_11875 [Halieaceae bacterium IMCC14734]|uniref:Uncharacterized protein n=1 Tax=Candidatus Litorirhabdus singularis TaxID=2518993 RepID=A0ABT3TID2_9GAMM|nr:hypothetical protein [Candidatus Litorirhabdus singularis]MCX2981560.1 hypothetical protein [Candidatus Litorirhabdus singularis]
MTRDKQWFAIGPNDPVDRLLSLVPRLPVADAGWTALGAAACIDRFPVSYDSEACFIAQTEWSDDMRPVHLSYWEIGLDPERRYWLLWRSCLESPRRPEQRLGSTTDGVSSATYQPLWHSRPVAACERGELGMPEAAVLLLRVAWRELLTLHGIPAPDFYDATSLVNTLELRELARQVWGG